MCTVDGSRTMSPGAGSNSGMVMLWALTADWFMPLYRNCCPPRPWWLMVPSHASLHKWYLRLARRERDKSGTVSHQPGVQPFEK